MLASAVIASPSSADVSTQPPSERAQKAGAKVTAWASAGQATTSAGVAKQRPIMLLAGAPGSTALQMAQDVASVLGGDSKIRVLPVAGRGGVQNVIDLVSLEGIDLAVTQTDVLAGLARGEFGDGIKSDQIAYIAKLGNAEVHVLAREDVRDIAELAGQAVNFGERGSGEQFTARRLFAALGIAVREVNLSHQDAMARLLRGEIAASILIGGKPVPDAVSIGRSQGLRLLPVAYVPTLEAHYLPAKLTHADYPELIGEGASVDTIAVGAALIVANWEVGHERHSSAAQFVESLFGRLRTLQEPARHAKWQEINLPAPVAGIVQFGPAKAWIEREIAAARGGGTAMAKSLGDGAPPTGAIAGPKGVPSNVGGSPAVSRIQ